MPRTLTEDEIIEVLEEIIRDGTNAQARIAAIRALREVDRGNVAPTEALAALDELAPRRQRLQTKSKTVHA